MSIFDILDKEENNSLFAYRNIFSADYIADDIKEIICRKKEIDTIARNINRFVRKGSQIELYVYGLTGIGKSYVIRGVLREAEKRFSDTFKFVWINCKRIRPFSSYSIYSEILTQLNNPLGGKKGFSSRDKWNHVQIINSDSPFVLVLDEADVFVDMKERDLLYSLIDSELSLIMISNVFNWVNSTEMRIQSRASRNSLIFKNYSKDQMFTVLRFIAEKGLKRDVLSDNVLEEISDYIVNRLMSDVRKGKNLIAASVEEAMKDGVSQVTIEHVERAKNNVNAITLAQILSNFSPIELIALAGFVSQRLRARTATLLGKNEPATTEIIYPWFERTCEKYEMKPVTSTQMKSYLDRFEGSKILYHEQRSHVTRGRANFYFSDYPIDELQKALTANGIEPIHRTIRSAFSRKS